MEANQVSRLPYLRTWFRTKRAIVLHLSNGILQVRDMKINDGISTISLPQLSTVATTAYIITQLPSL